MILQTRPSVHIIGLTVFITHVASAASEGEQSASDSVISVALGFLPIVIFIAVLFFFFRRYKKSPLVKLQQQYLEREIQHTQRVEKLLDRIATALEKK